MSRERATGQPPADVPGHTHRRQTSVDDNGIVGPGRDEQLLPQLQAPSRPLPGGTELRERPRSSSSTVAADCVDGANDAEDSLPHRPSVDTALANCPPWQRAARKFWSRQISVAAPIETRRDHLGRHLCCSHACRHVHYSRTVSSVD